MRITYRAGRVALAAATAALALGVTAGAASADGQLRWTMQNSYTFIPSPCSVPPGLNCTWLGHITNPTPGANGTATAGDGALGTTVTPSSPRGAGIFYTFGFPFTDTGSSSPVYTGGGDTFKFEGTMSFIAPVPPNGHGITMTLVDPKVVLAGDGSGELYASGLTTPGGPGTTAPYDETEPVFDLDLSTSTVTTDADGTQTIGLIVPSIHQGDYAFPGYPTGAGPDRTPNTFGSFTLVLNSPEGSAGPAGPAGPQGEKGDAGAQGVRGPAGAPGVAGARGKRGKQGKRGKPGKSATAKKKAKRKRARAAAKRKRARAAAKRKRVVRRAAISLR